ncbi:MAG: fumarylacetoacetate hydrolase family protein [Proteobacteria bacterium]|nr:fumarylacetoacetate hydrolase family protein [Pseudomonadota bacterium]MBS0495870.1 fumarylacetoacetate hydrolase family protein [Pseudomonadota bacterium]
MRPCCTTRCAQDGERVIGKKIGVTSKPVQDMLGVHQPDFGFLTNTMPYGAGVSLSAAGLIQPRVEGEIVFMLKKDLQGPGVTREDVMAATAWVAPCFEIVDSRIHDWKIKIQDTVADNASCGVFVVGRQHTDPRSLDLAAAAMQMSRTMRPRAAAWAAQGHPAEAVAWLANTLGAFGIPFKAGELILSGSLAPLVPAQAGDRFRTGFGLCLFRQHAAPCVAVGVAIVRLPAPRWTPGPATAPAYGLARP